jgi:hypothetical protein
MPKTISPEQVEHAVRQAGRRVGPALIYARAPTDATTVLCRRVVCPAFALTFRQPRLATLAAPRIDEDVMDLDHKEGPLDSLPFFLRWETIRVAIGLIIVIIVGYWQLIATVADHQRGQPGDGRGYDRTCRTSAPDAADCRLPPRAAD